jgi:hypothetical protein
VLYLTLTPLIAPHTTLMTDHDNTADNPVNIRATHYYVLQASHSCRHCKTETPVVAIALPGGHHCTEADTLAHDDDFMGIDGAAFRDWLFTPEQWYEIEGPAIISSVASLADSVAAQIQAINPRYTLDGEGNARQWINHCKQCGATIGDGILHATLGTPFSPKDSDAAATIAVHHVNAPLSAYYGMCWNDGYAIKAALFAHIHNVQS